MPNGSLLPFSRPFLLARWTEDFDPLLAFRREMNRLFDDFFAGFGWPSLGGRMLSPQVEVSETDREIEVAAELPGLDAKDLEVTVADDMLTIRGEKKEERDRKERNYHLAERSYGAFSRTLRLPFAADPQQAKAVFKDGVLKITIPKPQEMQQKTRRIEVRRGDAEPAAAPSSPTQAQQGGEQPASQAAAE